MILQMYWKVNKYNFNMISYIGIGYIKKDSKNQIKLEPKFHELLPNKDNIIEIDEQNNEKKITNNNDKLIYNNLLLKKIENEINLINYLYKLTKEKIILYRENYRNLYKENNNLKNILNNNNNTNNISNLSQKQDDNEDELIPNINDLKNIFPNYDFDSIFNGKGTNINFGTPRIIKIPPKTNNENQELYNKNKIEDNANLFELDYKNIFINDKIKNENYLEQYENNNLEDNLRKVSFMSGWPTIGNLNSVNYDKDNYDKEMRLDTNN